VAIGVFGSDEEDEGLYGPASEEAIIGMDPVRSAAER
jgi:hypothetical protein